MITMPVTHTLPDGTKLAMSTDAASEGILYGEGIVRGLWVYAAHPARLSVADGNLGSVKVTDGMLREGRKQRAAYEDFQGGRPPRG